MDSLRNAISQSTFKIIYEQLFEKSHPNRKIVLQIFLTLPVIHFLGKMSFIKLKLIKYYLKSSMKQHRFINLSIILIEHQKIYQSHFRVFKKI